MCQNWDQRGVWGVGREQGMAEGLGLMEIKGVGPCGELDTWDNEMGNNDLIGGQVSYRWK